MVVGAAVVAPYAAKFMRSRTGFGNHRPLDGYIVIKVNRKYFVTAPTRGYVVQNNTAFWAAFVIANHITIGVAANA